MTTRIPTTCALDCPDACGTLAEVDTDGRLVRLRGNAEHPYSRGALCGKTALFHELVHAPDRITTPLVRAGGTLREATWDEALDTIAERLSGVAGERILALWYGGSMGVVQRKYPLRVMHALGATLHDGGICDAASTAGYQAVLGRMIGPDVETVGESDLVVLWGIDVARTMPHLQPALQRLCRSGVPVVAIDVWRSDTIRALERWGGRGLVIAPGTDAALALALTRAAFERGDADRDFLERECLGGAEFEQHVRLGVDTHEAARITGLDEEALIGLLDLLTRARNPFLKVGVGWTRRRNGAMGMRAVCSLAAVLGHAHCVHYMSADHFDIADDVVTRPDLRPPEAPTAEVTHVQVGPLLEAGRFDAVFVWCHNPAVTLPGADRVRAGLARSDVFTVVHESALTETAEVADVVLPATTFVEHTDLYKSYGHRVLQLARKACEPPVAGPLPNVEAFAAIARRLGLGPEVWDVDAVGLCDALLDGARERIGADALARVRAGEPVKLEPLAVEGWGTPSGRVELVSAAARAAGQPPMASWVEDDASGDRGRFVLVCAPSVHTHNSTYVQSARHARKAGPPRAHLNPEDLRELEVTAGGRVRLANERAALTLEAVASVDVPRGLVRVDGLLRRADVPEQVGVGALLSTEVSDLGNGNVMFSARVDVVPVDPLPVDVVRLAQV